jgi:hypothetical protein
VQDFGFIRFHTGPQPRSQYNYSNLFFHCFRLF